jgi:DNA-directed RNA polymerase specialized sigma24 family protein
MKLPTDSQESKGRRQAGHPASNTEAGIKKLAIQYSWKMVRSLAVPLQEREDIQQDLHLALWLRLPRLNESRGAPPAFLHWVVKNEGLRIIEKRTAGRRDYRLCIGLDEPACERIIGTCKDPFRREDRLILKADVQRGLRALSPKLRRVAIALQEASPTDLLGLLGISRASLYRLIEHIRTEFEALGLDVYINVSPRAQKKNPRKRKKV